MINKISHLKYPPIKNKITNFPKLIIWQEEVIKDTYRVNLYKTDRPKAMSKIFCYKINEFTPNDNLNSLYIITFDSIPKRQGLGKELFKYAKKLSKQLGCEGRITLSADPRFSKNDVPHLFYKKCGMNTGNEIIDSQIDEFIKTGQLGTINDFNEIRMYYPPITKIQEKPALKENIFSKIKKLFKQK